MAPIDCVDSWSKIGIPGAAVVVRLPDTAVDLAHVENVWLAGNAGRGAGAAAAKRADHAPMQLLVSVLGNLLRAARRERQQYRDANHQTKNYLRHGHLGPLRHQKPNPTA